MTYSTLERRSEKWRMECEARHVLSLPFSSREPYLALVGKRRGAQGRLVLEAEVRRQFSASRRAA
ncbi:DUF7696 family protein [Achromobacter anxifer]|uniref:DUF7696 family protein n=1 Tax=Achromobacter anxifer TaxID=1287737 RepID=UPI003F5B0F5A